MRTILVFFIIWSFYGCSGLRSLTLYVKNIKESEKSVNLKVYINDSLCVNDKFAYSAVTPNYDVYVYKFDKGIHALKVLKDDNQLLTDTFDLNNDMFVYISYEGLQGEGRCFIKKTTINYKLH